MASKPERIETIRAFERDLKALKKKHVDIRRILPAIQAIMDGDRDTLASRYRDHALAGNWSGYCELHIEGDWLLVYFIDGTELVLVLTRTASHDELFSARTDKHAIDGYRKAPRQSFP